MFFEIGEPAAKNAKGRKKEKDSNSKSTTEEP